MATLGGAICLGREDTGSLAPRQAGDLVVWPLAEWLSPVPCPIPLRLFCAAARWPPVTQSLRAIPLIGAMAGCRKSFSSASTRSHFSVPAKKPSNNLQILIRPRSLGISANADTPDRNRKVVEVSREAGSPSQHYAPDADTWPPRLYGAMHFHS